MAWVVPLYDREQVNIAGRTRINDTASADAKESALGIVNNWRSAHSFPLNCFQVTLRDRAHSINPGALIAQRLKRLVAIEAKLRRFSAMKLSQELSRSLLNLAERDGRASYPQFTARR